MILLFERGCWKEVEGNFKNRTFSIKEKFDAKTLAARRRKVFLEKEIEKIHFSITSSRRQRLCVKNSPSF